MHRILAVLLFAASPALADDTHQVQHLTDHVFVIVGKGGNIGLYVGDDRAVLVDTLTHVWVSALYDGPCLTGPTTGGS